MSTVAERKQEMWKFILIGAIPPRLAKDALLICDDVPPRWRVVKRFRYVRAFSRVARWAGWAGLESQ